MNIKEAMDSIDKPYMVTLLDLCDGVFNFSRERDFFRCDESDKDYSLPFEDVTIENQHGKKSEFPDGAKIRKYAKEYFDNGHKQITVGWEVEIPTDKNRIHEQ